MSYRMNKRLSWIVPCVLLCASAVALDSAVRPPLGLEPAPKEVQLRDGGFRVRSGTKIFVQLGHQSEDRIAAETLAEEIADQSGMQLDILGMDAAGKAGEGGDGAGGVQELWVGRFVAGEGRVVGE